MRGHISFQVGSRCWNLHDSFGEICVHCGCCSSDKTTRRKARLEVAKRQLQENLSFDRWDDDPKWRAIQEKNVKSNIRYWRRRVRYYEKALKED